MWATMSALEGPRIPIPVPFPKSNCRQNSLQRYLRLLRIYLANPTF